MIPLTNTSSISAYSQDWQFPNTHPDISFIPIDDCATPELWESVLHAQSLQAVGYQRELISYHHCYFASTYPGYRKLDCLIFWRKQIVGIWPLAIFTDHQETRISSHFNGAYGVIPPLFIPGIQDKQTKTLTLAWLKVISALSLNEQLPKLSELRFISPSPWLQAPDWYRRLQLLGAKLIPKHQLIADLSLSSENYRHFLRKSYKSLISTAEKLWKPSFDTAGDTIAFEQFQKLHEQVAGRKTRSTESWKCQLDAIRRGLAFAIYLHDANAKLIGASYFTTSADEASYGVGAYDRNLFDQPVAHLSLYRAIEYCRGAGKIRIILGDRPFPADSPPPTNKELQIAFFKEGFATELQLLPTLEISAAQLAAHCDLALRQQT